MDRELSLLERTKMRAHIMLCDACFNFTNQMQTLRRAMRKFGLVDADEESPSP
jgi:hypothetical protein